MPTNTLRTSKPMPFFHKGHQSGLYVGAQNMYQIQSQGLVYSPRGTNFGSGKTHALTPGFVQGWSRSAGGTTMQVLGADSFPTSARGGPTLTLPAVAGNVNEARFAPSRGYTPHLAVAHATSPFLSIYNLETATKLADPATLPAGTGNAAAWSPDGEYICVAHATSPFFTVYQITKPTAGADFTFTKLTNPGTLPTQTGLSCAFSPGYIGGKRLLAVGTLNSAGAALFIYEVSGTTLTFLYSARTETGVYDLCWSPSGRFLAASEYLPVITQNSVVVFEWVASGPNLDVFAAGVPASGNVQGGVAWGPNEDMVILDTNISPYVHCFFIDYAAVALDLMPSPSTLPSASIASGKFDSMPV